MAFYNHWHSGSHLFAHHKVTGINSFDDVVLTLMLINGTTFHFTLSSSINLLKLDATKINTLIGMSTSFYRSNKTPSFGTS